MNPMASLGDLPETIMNAAGTGGEGCDPASPSGVRPDRLWRDPGLLLKLRTLSRALAIAFGLAILLHPSTARAALPVITSNPSSQSITANGTATFRVTATSATSYQWQISFDGVTWTPIDNFVWSNFTADTATLTVTNAPIALSGTIVRCLASSASGSTASASASLTVSAPSGTTLYTLSDPGGRYESGYLSGLSPTFHTPLLPSSSASNITFTFGYGGGSGQGVTITWQTSTTGTAPWTNVSGYTISADGMTLTVPTASTTMNGLYFRAYVVDNGSSTNTLYTNPARLDVIEPIGINSNASGDGSTNGSMHTAVSTVATFVANGSGTKLPLTYQWYISTTGGTAGSWSAVGGATSATLTVWVGSAAQNQNMYYCAVKDSAGATTNTDPVVLTVP
jgi:hypothetical protein